ncbi:hypothetical protein SAMN05216577_11093 [Pseudomonas citronellolis]|uniref:Uncharacterized protein n=1 Tax=Pseudomonas citronellolis TaxID=53408 RepID=A0AAQ1HMP1_9PSED|nr:hypothetical protein [Pseudomonas citronellolis]TGC21004.1 hypothetical protein CW310_31295 [Pseudomonas citronellolis]SFC76717.1 hypothetical protein SAMN05216577_11093 [Pseudomonas citronellolis]
MQAHQPQGGGAKASTPDYKVGDRVSFPVIRRAGSGFRISIREACIAELGGLTATVRYGNGRTDIIRLDDLTPAGQPNALTRALLGDQVEGKAND